jgi:uncharacterized protein (TIGR02145 family)
LHKGLIDNNMNKINSLLLFSPLILINTQSYAQTVTIGTQVWMVQNLNVDKFRNGDPIPQAKTDEEWQKAAQSKQPAWCYLNNNSASGKLYGKLYNWFAVNDPRGLAPSGYHIPTDEEWTTLTSYLGGEFEAGEKMRSTSGWEGNTLGSNSSGFTGLPGGRRLCDGEVSLNDIGAGLWWSSTVNNPYVAWSRSLQKDNLLLRFFSNKGDGLSVRCLRD